MAKLDIGIGEDFPVEEKSGGEECRHRRHGQRHHHHHHGFWHDYFRRRLSRGRDKDKAGTAEKTNTTEKTNKE
jgi:hypothetical protein